MSKLILYWKFPFLSHLFATERFDSFGNVAFVCSRREHVGQNGDSWRLLVCFSVPAGSSPQHLTHNCEQSKD